MIDPNVDPLRHTDPTPISTDWSKFHLDEIWEMVATEDSRITSIQIGAWERLARLCDDQATQLERAMAQLHERWPPNPGSTSEAFSVQVASLISWMRQASDAGSVNPQPLRNISDVLTDARIEIAALMEIRQKYERIEEILAIPVNAAPNQERRPDPPPPTWRAHLDQQARDIMARADIIVGKEATDIQVPARPREIPPSTTRDYPSAAARRPRPTRPAPSQPVIPSGPIGSRRRTHRLVPRDPTVTA